MSEKKSTTEANSDAGLMTGFRQNTTPRGKSPTKPNKIRLSVSEIQDRARERARAWYYANRERAIANARRWAAANPEKVAASSRKWTQEHHAERLAYWRARQAANPTAARDRMRELRARRKAAGATAAQ